MKKKLLAIPGFGVLFCLISIFTLLRIPSLIEPYWYGDEGIYAVIGVALRDGALLYRDIWDNKPPILYLLYALVDGNLFGIKLMSLVFGVAAISVFYYFSYQFFKKQSSRIVSTGLFTFLFALPLLEGNIANAENFMLFPIVLGALLVFFHATKKSFFWAGLILSFALMIKIVAIFDIAAFLYILFLQINAKKGFSIASVQRLIINRHVQMLGVGLAILPISIGIFYLIKGSLFDFLSSVFTQNVEYVGVNNHFLFPLGWVVLKIFLVTVSLVVIYFLRKKFSSQELILYPWLVFALFSMFFSERPYTHYVLMGIPVFSLLIGYCVETIKHRAVIIATVVTIIVISFFPIYKKNIQYYKNYAEYILQKKDVYEYIGFFDRYAVRDYKVADTVKSLTTPQDEVYFWSDSAQLYILSEQKPTTKYIVGYHSLMYPHAYEVTKKQVKTISPRYIISTQGYSIPRDLLEGYTVKYIVEDAIFYEKNNR